MDIADALAAVHRARVRDDQANDHAAQTRRVLQEVAVAAVEAGAVKAHVASAAGISRDTLYQWLVESPTPAHPPKGTS